MTDYGRDLYCASDLTPDMRESSDISVLGEALVRRFDTPAGWLIDDPDYGLDLKDELSREQTPQTIAVLRAKVQIQALRDERISACSAEASFSLGKLTVQVRGTSSLGPFRLVVEATKVSVSLLEAS